MGKFTLNAHDMLIFTLMQGFDFEYTAVESSECQFFSQNSAVKS